jgi:ABC-type polysaccharide/polyol phosphate export permease
MRILSDGTAVGGKEDAAIFAQPSFLSSARAILVDLVSSFNWAWMDIKCRYRRSVIGPFWETINVLVNIIGMAYVASTVFHTNTMSNLPYVGLGIIVWGALLGVVNEGTMCFVFHKDLIKNATIGIHLYAGRTIFRIFIISGHHLILYLIGLILLPIPLTFTSLLALPGILLLLINSFWVMPALGLICARFRDLEMIIRNIMQLTFFITPVFWDYHSVPADRAFIVTYNPFFYFLQIIRSPLLGDLPPLLDYEVVLSITLSGFALLYFLYRNMRPNLAFYV